MKKVISILLIPILLFSFSGSAFAQEKAEKEESLCKPTEVSSYDSTYKCRVYSNNSSNNICYSYMTPNPSTVVKSSILLSTPIEWDYPDVESIHESWFKPNSPETNTPLKKAKEFYKERMNQLYKCALIDIQIKSLYTTLNNYLSLDKTNQLRIKVEENIYERINDLYKEAKDLCLEKDTYTSTNDILNETTYEYCRYMNYMFYLKEYYMDYRNIFKEIDLKQMWPGEKWELKYKDWAEVFTQWTWIKKDDKKTHQYVPKPADPEKFWKLQNKLINEIDDEIEYTRKIFPLAFQAYTEYKSHYPTHVLLMLVQADFEIYRDNLYKVLNAVNQVVSKAQNAMK